MLLAVALMISGCSQADGNSPGHEYMPDMAHSIAYEAMTYNYYEPNTWGSKEEVMKYSVPRKPVAGTIPRGYAGVAFATNDDARAKAMSNLGGAASGSVPYYYKDTEEDRTAATADPDLTNPFPITEKGLTKGKELYKINCAICHGEKGEANGHIVETGVYPAVPTSYLDEGFITSGDGRYYHAIMYGKNMMGSYKDKLSYEERWQVIHYIRSLQAKSQGREYLPVAAPVVNEAPKDLSASFTEMIKAGTGSISLNNVQFRTGSANLKESSFDELNGLSSILNENTGIKLRIGGHTDNVGNATNNKSLSEKRAAAVLNYLTGKGVAADRLEAVGYGADKPVDTNDTADGRAKNRRTEVEIIK